MAAQQDDTAPISMMLDGNDTAVRGALIALRGRMRRGGVPGDLAGTVEIVMAEVLNNIVEHAYAAIAGGRIGLRLWPGGDGIHCDIRDRGAPLPGLALPDGPPPPVDVPLDDLPEGGFGWYLIHRLASDLRYSRCDGENRLRFTVQAHDG